MAHIAYRREIDGLRAIAVIAVVLFHAGVAQIPGGFLGVDVFFVISGYLITSVLLAEMDRGAFSIARFYERRLRRLMPALFVVVAVTTIFASGLMLDTELRKYSQSLVVVSVFAGNVYFWLQSGYFSGDADLKPMLHTWSLGVEEQFYLCFPILVWLIWKTCRHWMAGILCTILLASLLVSELGWRSFPAANFFLLPSRAWELLAGSLVALIPENAAKLLSRRKRGMLTVLALAMLSLSMLLLDEASPLPGLLAVIPVGATAIILQFAGPENAVGRLLGHKYLVGIGLVSYGFYLWHQPIFVLARLTLPTPPTATLLLILALVSLLLAYCSWRWIETPIRSERRLTRAQVFRLSAGGSLAMMMIGLAGHLSNGAQELKLALMSPATRAVYPNIEAERDRSWKGVDSVGAAFENDARLRILLIGDSHSKDLYNAFHLNPELFEQRVQVRRLELFLRCILERYDGALLSGFCKRAFQSMQESQAIDQADVILIAPRWGSVVLPHTPEFVMALRALADRDAVIGFVGRTAEFVDPLRVLLRQVQESSGEGLERALAENRDISIDAVNDSLARLAARQGILYFDRTDLVCLPPRDRCAILDAERKFLFLDYGHWSLAGARFFGRRIHDNGWIDVLEVAAQGARAR